MTKRSDTPRKRMKPVVGWAGVVNGRLDLTPAQGLGLSLYGVVYVSRASAKRFYEEVRQVEVREIK